MQIAQKLKSISGAPTKGMFAKSLKLMDLPVKESSVSESMFLQLHKKPRTYGDEAFSHLTTRPTNFLIDTPSTEDNEALFYRLMEKYAAANDEANRRAAQEKAASVSVAAAPTKRRPATKRGAADRDGGHSALPANKQTRVQSDCASSSRSNAKEM